MSDGVTFDKDSARRIGKVVRAHEAEATVTSRPPKGRGLVPHSLDRPMMCIVKDAMVADDTAYTVKILEADATEGIEFEVRRPNGIGIAVGDVGFIGQDTSGQYVFMPAFWEWDYTAVAGYDAGKTQVLTHVTGTLTWVDTVECT